MSISWSDIFILGEPSKWGLLWFYGQRWQNLGNANAARCQNSALALSMARLGSKSGHDSRFQDTDTFKRFAGRRSQARFANGSQAKSHTLVKLLCNHMQINTFLYKTLQRNAAPNSLLNTKL
jgi:hypothetical protein